MRAKLARTIQWRSVYCVTTTGPQAMGARSRARVPCSCLAGRQRTRPCLASTHIADDRRARRVARAVGGEWVQPDDLLVGSRFWHVPWITNAGTVAPDSMPCTVKTTVSCVWLRVNVAFPLAFMLGPTPCVN